MTPLTRLTLSSALLIFSVETPSLHALTPELTAAPVQDDAAYTTGSKAMDEHRWQDAVASFRQGDQREGEARGLGALLEGLFAEQARQIAARRRKRAIS